mmetsp:Transcript_77419/g.214050  ORF Transcript_77419/g.214050 Transcript_77419/m.214050 type:complete len:445 (-) Transcript_77419:57-1391(-)|eukprot:CAMPEP_0179096516 /NCGR_PEP_ID=MMETSP0796-20121207/44375_1 /TAXON_ID=73915 /ORGANISM="Pyrodinium bahamense, Strain pbaha01" /LENGTH=444 /DNA_ID=CAMNT_0020794239 /DNA_START=99 /DNA_END=1433 /DNA_ORIENTATION=-
MAALQTVTDVSLVPDSLLSAQCMKPALCTGKSQESVQNQHLQQAQCIGDALRSKLKELEGCTTGDIQALFEIIDALQATLSAALACTTSPPTVADSACSETSEGSDAPSSNPADADPLSFLAHGGCQVTASSVGANAGLLFPGWGSEYVLMLSDCRSLPGVVRMLAKANNILGCNILEICLKGPGARLADPRYSQPALFIAGLAAFEKLHRQDKELAESFRAVTGFGIGVYTALCVAGVISFEDGLSLARTIGEVAAASAVPSHGFVTIMGLPKSVVSGLCARAARMAGGSALCEVVLDLTPICKGCAGTAEAISHLRNLAKRAGAHWVRQESRHGALHTRLMKSHQEKVGEALREVLPRMSPPRCECYSVLTGLPMGPGTSPAEIVRDLTEFWTRPVSYEVVVKNMIKDGVTQFFELGPQTRWKDIMAFIDNNACKTMRNIQV